MKRLIAILLSIILLCMIVGCHGSSKKTEDAAINNKTKETSDNLGQTNSSSLSSTEIDNSQDAKSTPDGEVKIAGYRIFEEEDGYVYFDVLVFLQNSTSFHKSLEKESFPSFSYSMNC